MIRDPDQTVARVVAALCRASTELAVVEQLVDAASDLGFTDSRAYFSIDCPIQKTRVHTLVAQYATTISKTPPGYRIAFATLGDGEHWSVERGDDACRDPNKAIWVRELGLQNHEWLDIAIRAEGETVGLWSLSVRVESPEQGAIEYWHKKIDILAALATLAANQVLNIKKPEAPDSLGAKDLEKFHEASPTDYIKQEILPEIFRGLDAQFVSYFEYDSERHSLIKVAELLNGEPIDITGKGDTEYSLHASEGSTSLTASAFTSPELEFIPFFESIRARHPQLANGASITLHESLSGCPVNSVMYCRLGSIVTQPGLIRIINRKSNPRVALTRRDYHALQSIASAVRMRLLVRDSINTSRQTKAAADALFDLRLSETDAYQRSYAALRGLGFESFQIFIGDHNRRIVRRLAPSIRDGKIRKLRSREIDPNEPKIPDVTSRKRAGSDGGRVQDALPQAFCQAYEIPKQYEYAAFGHAEGTALVTLGLGNLGEAVVLTGRKGATNLPLTSSLQTILDICAHGMTVRHNQAAIRDAQMCVAIIAHEFRSPSKWLGSLTSTLIRNVLHFFRAQERGLTRPLRFASPVASDGTIEVKSQREMIAYLEKFPSRIELADRRLTRAVKDGLTWARMQSNIIELEFESINLSDVVKSALEEMGLDIGGARGVSVRLDSKGATQACAVPDLMQGLFVNIVDNAVKYSYANQIVPIRLVADGNEVVISVTNYGTGIAPTDLPHIFTPFYRAKHRDITHPIRGVGLGLPTCKRIVDVHRGTISASSEKWHFDDPVRVERMEGFKTTFTVRIPTNLPIGRRDVDNASLTSGGGENE